MSNPKRTTTRNADEYIARREEFTTGGALRGVALRGRRDHDGGWVLPFTGQLPQEWSEVLVKDRPYYVVYSYSTPIAWFNGTHWTIPDTRHSVTTSRHQSTVRRGASMSGEYILWENVYGASTLPD